MRFTVWAPASASQTTCDKGRPLSIFPKQLSFGYHAVSSIETKKLFVKKEQLSTKKIIAYNSNVIPRWIVPYVTFLATIGLIKNYCLRRIVTCQNRFVSRNQIAIYSSGSKKLDRITSTATFMIIAFYGAIFMTAYVETHCNMGHCPWSPEQGPRDGGSHSIGEVDKSRPTTQA